MWGWLVGILRRWPRQSWFVVAAGCISAAEVSLWYQADILVVPLVAVVQIVYVVAECQAFKDDERR